MEERRACALLKERFEQAGFRIEENQAFEEDGIRFEIDGFDAARRVGYEYVTSEAGDSWDVDGNVIAALEDRRQRGELHILVVDEAQAPDEATLQQRADAFLASLPGQDAGELGSMTRGLPREPPANNKPKPEPPAARPKAKAAKKPAKKPQGPGKKKR